MPDFYLPYLLNYAQPVAEDIIIFIIAMLSAIMVSAEGQAFMATFLGDSKPGATDRFHFNVFLHMSILGTLSFFVSGFGWAKEITVDTRNFKRHPRLYLFFTRMSGPLANLLMANIAASLSWIITQFDFDDRVFSTMVVVNVTMAIYGLLPVAPLPGGAIFSAFFPSTERIERIKKICSTVGPYVLIGGFLALRISGWDIVSDFFNPIVSTLTTTFLDI